MGLPGTGVGAGVGAGVASVTGAGVGAALRQGTLTLYIAMPVSVPHPLQPKVLFLFGTGILAKEPSCTSTVITP